MSNMSSVMDSLGRFEKSSLVMNDSIISKLKNSTRNVFSFEGSSIHIKNLSVNHLDLEFIKAVSSNFKVSEVDFKDS